MRIRRLDLARYGRFTDLSLDFGEAGDGPDLHIVYGPNEAGKSTVFNAFLDLLYGIPVQSPYNFLHPYPTLKIGAALEVGGTVREFVRIKRSANSLLDGEGRALGDSSMQAALGGIGREAYRSMFSLDDDSLEAGGKAILDSRGDLGELLFSATSGLAELSRRLGDVEAKADKFYRYHAHHGELNDLKAKLAELKEQREAIDMAAGEYRRLVEMRERADESYSAAVQARGLSQARIDRVVACLGALPRLTALRETRGQLEPLQSLPHAPPGWAHDVPLLQKDAVRLATLIHANAEEIERLGREIALIEPDASALRLADRMELLNASRARAFTASKDLPERRLSLRGLDVTIEGIVARLGRSGEEDASRLVLTAAQMGRLQPLIEVRSGIDAALTSASDEHAAAERRLAEAKANVAESLDVARPHAALLALPKAIKAARDSDHATKARIAERAVAKASRLLDQRLDELHPFVGTVDQLIGVDVPDVEVLQAWRDGVADLETRRVQLVDRQAACERTIVQLGAEREAIVATGGSSSEMQAAALRTARERAWAHHKSQLDAATADAFEDAMRRDDVAGDRRVSDAEDRAKLRRIDEAAATATFDRKLVTGLLDALGRELDAIYSRAAEAWGAATGDSAPPRDLPAFARWLERRADALKILGILSDAKADLCEAVDDGEAAMRDLRAALVEASVPFEARDGFEALIATGQEAADAETRLSGLRSKERECARDLVERATRLAVAKTKDEEWASLWREACAACWLGDRGAEPTLATVREALAALGPLEAAVEKRTALDDRITKMEHDLEAFTSDAAAFAVQIDEAVGEDAFETTGRVASRVAGAAAASERRRKLVSDLESVRQRQRELLTEAAVNAGRIEEMTAHYGVDDLTAVAERLNDVLRRSNLERDAVAMQREILDLLGQADIGEAERLLDAADREAFERERGELKIRLEDEDKRCHELFAAASTAAERVAGIGADERVAMIEERRRTTILEIDEGARRYLRLRAGILAMEHALRLHRDRSRGTMITEASEAFATMSRGAYTSLATQPHKDREILIALAGAGGSKSADQLSKGTRFQLYLSLRVAGYLGFAQDRHAVPFVGDDIMESFDDFRAEETLKLFAKMAGVGQVVYFTHHRHLLPIAREVCPTITVHELAAAEQVAA